MTIRDRGLQKWQGFFMTEHVTGLKKVHQEMEKCEKPLIDEHQQAEFDEKVAYAMTFNKPIKLRQWIDGYFKNTVGRVHYHDVIKQQLRVETLKFEFVRIELADVVSIEIVDD